MRRKLGKICMGAGAVLLAVALSLFLWNRFEDIRAGNAAESVLEELKDQTGEAEDASGTEMPEADIDGYSYIGYVSIPSLGLELPVMSDWSYEQLRIAPCRYCGSVETGDLVIAAHNYSRHFGNLKDLSPGDEVYFTDLSGKVSFYIVAEVDTLNPSAVEEMTSSGYGLTLFTCTYSGQSRVTVRCERTG